MVEIKFGLRGPELWPLLPPGKQGRCAEEENMEDILILPLTATVRRQDNLVSIPLKLCSQLFVI